MQLAQLKAAIEAEALRRDAARDGFTLEALQSFLGSGFELSPEILASAQPAPQPLTYGYFAGLHGRTFVLTCYRLLLGRDPDPHGLAHYAGLLEDGEDKAFVIGAMAYSGEGRRRGVRVQGLLWRFLIAAGQRVPVAGALFAWLVAVVSLSARARAARAAEQRLHARLDAVAEHLERSSAQIAMRLEALRTVLEPRD